MGANDPTARRAGGSTHGAHATRRARTWCYARQPIMGTAITIGLAVSLVIGCAAQSPAPQNAPPAKPTAPAKPAALEAPAAPVTPAAPDEPSVAAPVDVFVGGEAGHAVYRIPSIVRLAGGTLLAFAEGRGSQDDNGSNDIVCR
ncbi:MAG: exo-alpha-sialidase, partial [Proteobacteria bacterium]|nr:exo-alpha-sialidase [Pseudomonadota bacterium]